MCTSRDAHCWGVARRGQQPVFAGCSSHSQHWEDVGGISLTNFSVPKWHVCLRRVVQDLFGRRLGSVGPEQLLVGTNEHPAHLSRRGTSYPSGLLSSVHRVKCLINA